MNEKIKIRFELKFIKIDDGCWTWNAYKSHDGYGVFWYDGKRIRAPRFSYMLYKGEIPKGMFVCHKCDNPSCVNPDHLWLGTAKDNALDMVKKGRDAKNNLGKKMSEENKKKIGLWSKNLWESPGYKEKMSKIASEVQKGHVTTPETKEKIKNTLMGHIVTPETREKIRIAAIKQFQDPKQREIARKNSTGRKQSEETIEKRRQSFKIMMQKRAQNL